MNVVNSIYLLLLFSWFLLELYLLVFTNVFVVKYSGKDKSIFLFFSLLAFCLVLPFAITLYRISHDRNALFGCNSFTIKFTAAILLLVGLVIRTRALFLLKKSTVNSNKPSLLTKGMYTKIRHPSYLGSILCYAGYSLFIDAGAAAIVFLAVIIAHVSRIFPEEKYLQAQYGLLFEQYQRQTKRLVPFIF